MFDQSNPAPQPGTSTESYEAPVTSTEKAIVDTFEELFQIDNVSVSSDIFELGGNSLTAQQLIWRIRDLYGFDVPLSTIFDAPTARELAAEIDLLLAT